MLQSIVCIFFVFWVLSQAHGEEVLTPLTETSEILYSTKDMNQQRYYADKNVSPASCQPTPTALCAHNDYPPGTLRKCEDEYYLTPCYCLSNDFSNDSDPLIAYCQYTCFKNKYLITSSLSSLYEEQCSPFRRKGAFCSECNNGTAYPAYSFSLKCVHCRWGWRNVVKYVAVAYGPLTVFLFLLMAFRVSVNSAPLLGFIFVAQISSIPFQLKIGVGAIESGEFEEKPYQAVGIHILTAAYSIWNLDFFRSIIPPFCLHPDWTVMQIRCLDYVISSYPFVIILFTYTIVEFYSRGYRICLWWKPFHRCFAQLRSGMNIKTSLVDAFGTFFSLSYSKTLNTTGALLAFTHTWNSEGGVGHRVPYYAPSDDFQPTYVGLAIFFFVLFNILPIIVLFFYSLRQPPQEENVEGFFQPLLETLLTSYRDGKDGGRNCRFFCIAYLTARIVINVALIIMPNIFFQLVAAFILLIIGMLVAVIKPYKSTIYNTVDTVLMLTLALAYISIAGYFFANFIAPIYTRIPEILCEVVCVLPLLYMLALVFYHVVWVSKLPQRANEKLRKMCSSLKKLFRRVSRSPRHEHPAHIATSTTTYVHINSDSVQVINVELHQ